MSYQFQRSTHPLIKPQGILLLQQEKTKISLFLAVIQLFQLSESLPFSRENHFEKEASSLFSENPFMQFPILSEAGAMGNGFVNPLRYSIPPHRTEFPWQ